MKKVLTAVLITSLLTASAFAETIMGINFSVPLASKTWDFEYTQNDADISSLGFGINFNKMSVKGGEDWGYSSIFGAGLGYVDINAEVPPTEVKVSLEGIYGTVKWGWGIAPLCRENIILGIHGFIGLDCWLINEGNDSDSYTGHDFDILFGGDVFCAVKIKNSMAVTFGVDVASNLIGSGTIERRDNGISLGMNDSFEYMTSRFTITPRIGISWGM